MALAAQTISKVLAREYEPADEHAVVDLLGLAFEGWPTGLPRVDPLEFFRWKTVCCPFGESRSWVVENAGEIVGFLAQLPWQLTAGAQTVTTMRGTDLAVHPAHRRRGISQALLRAAMQAHAREVALAWNNPNALSRGSVLKAGQRNLLAVRRYARPGIHPARARARVRSRSTRMQGALEVHAPAARDVLRDGAFLERLLRSAPRHPERITTARTAQYLQWRYEFEDYRAIRAGRGAGGEGVAVFRVRRSGRVWLTDVCELIAPSPRAERELLWLVGRVAPTDVCCCAFPSHAQALRYGFPARAGQIELTLRRVHGGLAVDPTQRTRWALSLGDLELL